MSYTDRETKAAYIAKEYSNIMRDSVLDVGAGECYLKKYLPVDVRYVSVGLSEYVDILFNLEYGLTPIEGSFYTVVCTDVLEHIDNIHFLFGELVRVSSRYILISLPNSLKSILDNFLLGGSVTLPKYHCITDEFKLNRHKWVFNYDDIVRFIRTQAAKHGLKVLHVGGEAHYNAVYNNYYMGKYDLKNLTAGYDLKNLTVGTVWGLLEKC